MVTREALIIGAALAVIHQIEMGEIAQRRSAGTFDEDSPLWGHFKQLHDTIIQGGTPDPDLLEKFPAQVIDGLAHLRQSMRVDYDEWFPVFPWLE